MTADPELVKAGLDHLADQAGPLRTQAADVARRIRRRRTARISASAAVCTALAVTGAAALPRFAATHTGPAAAGRDRRIVSFHGLQAGVPASWPTGAEHCGTPTRDTVLLSGQPELLCLERPTHFDVLEIGPLIVGQRTDTLNDVRRRGTTLGGHPAWLQEVRLTDGRTRVMLSVPSLDAMLIATTRDPALARQIIASVRVSPRDFAGCLDPLPGFQPRSADPADPAMVPGGFTSATVCAYENLRVASSAAVSPADARDLAGRLNGLKPGLQSLGPINKPGKESRPRSCTADLAAAARNAFLIRFTYPRNGLSEIVVRWDGCTDIGVTNGTTTGHVTYPLLERLTALTGRRFGGTALEDFVPR